MAPLAVRNTMIIAGLGAIALAVIAPVLVPLAFGNEFDDSVRPRLEDGRVRVLQKLEEEQVRIRWHLERTGGGGI